MCHHPNDGKHETANVNVLNAQDAQMSTGLDEATTLTHDLKAKSLGAWTKFDNRIDDSNVTIAEVETKVESLKSNANHGEARQMRLIDDKSINPPLFSGDSKKYVSWARSMKAYFGSRYSEFHKMLDKAELEDTDINMEMVDGTQWRHARESNTKLLNLLALYTEL